jgi:tRNA1Val (adenine37-N6)-methyltransferase
MKWSHDTFLDGRLKICQSRHGYRFSMDPIILAYHANPAGPGERILDLGTGCGIMPLIIAYRFPEVNIIGVEIQAELAAQARCNIAQNGYHSRIKIIEGDFLALKADAIGSPVNMVITNPPFRKPCSGRINPQSQRALARHEIYVSLNGLIKTMGRFLAAGGQGWIVYPTERLTELMASMRARHLEPKYMRLIHSRSDQEAKRCLLKVVKAARPGLIAGPPLIIHDKEGGYTEEVAAMFLP